MFRSLDLCPKGSDFVVDKFIYGLIKNTVTPTITVDLSDAHSDMDQKKFMHDVFNALNQNRHIKTLKFIHRYSVSMLSLKILFQEMQQNTFLTEVKLSSPIAPELLADFINQTETLKKITLTYSIGNNDFITLIQHLKPNPTGNILLLDLKNNKIEDGAAYAIIEALQTGHYPPTLKLDLNKNNISPYLLTTIKAQLKTFAIKHTAHACITLQQGARQDSSPIVNLPQEILEHIYQYMFLFPTTKNERKNVVRNIYRACHDPTFFNRSPKIADFNSIDAPQSASSCVDIHAH